MYVLALLYLNAASVFAAESTTAPKYAALRTQLRASAVPVLLPRRIPSSLGRIRFVSVITAGRDGYYVGFSTVAGCGGGLSCAAFHVAGFPIRTQHDYRRQSIVRLADGTRAYYRNSDCSGAACTEASLIFERAADVYELDAKAGRNNLPALESVYAALDRVR